MQTFSLPALNELNLNTLLRPQSVKAIVTTLKYTLWALAAIFLVFIARELLDRLFSNALDAPLANNNVVSTNQTFETINARGDYSLIAKKNIFGEIALPPKTVPTPVSDKPKTTLPLELIGTFISDKAQPYAIIENKKKNEQEVFNLGETIFGEAKLVAITAYQVEIERNGQIEILSLDDGIPFVGPSEGGVASVSPNEFIVDEAELDKALENLPLLLQQARAVPYFRDGKADGLRLFAIRPDSLFAKVGLKNGDILKTINGKSMADPSQALKLFEELKDERSINVVLERNRVVNEFKYEIR